MARVSRPAYDPQCYRLPPRKPLSSREALVLWVGLQPLRPAGGAGTERYLTRFLVRPEYMG